MKYFPTIGLEIHAELKTRSKMFCSCKNDSEQEKPNTNVCPVCMAHPGTLPVINKKAVRLVIKTGLALYCGIQQKTWFERKNYFYPDLPKGYQISQYAAPLCKNGFLQTGKEQVTVERVHLEEDTAKLTHLETGKSSLVDFNRAGVPLMELVTKPDIHSAAQAKAFAKELQLILQYLEVSEANMEKGQMRCEVNISLSPQTGHSDKSQLGTKVEIKNLNSLRAVEKAIKYEIERQTKILDKGEEVEQETRGWNDAQQTTFSQRAKEKAHEYRYFPEPDLPPLNIKTDFVNEIKTSIPELPPVKRERFDQEYGLKPEDIEFYIHNKKMSDYFEQVVSELYNWFKNKETAQLASNYISTNLQGMLKDRGVTVDRNFPITPENFAEFVKMLHKGEISSKIAKHLLDRMLESGGDPSHIVEDEGLKMVSDESELKKVIEKVIKNNSEAVGDYKSGKKEALKFLMGKVMAETGGKADPQTTQRILRVILKKGA